MRAGTGCQKSSVFDQFHMVLVQYNKNEKLRESMEELLKMFRDGVSGEEL